MIILACDRLQDSALVELLNDLPDPRFQRELFASILYQNAVPQRVVQVPYDTFEIVRLVLGCFRFRLWFEILSDEIHNPEKQGNLVRVVVRNQFNIERHVQVDNPHNFRVRNPHAMKTWIKFNQLLKWD